MGPLIACGLQHCSCVAATVVSLLSAPAQKTLMVLATNSVWPSGISPLLWCCYFTPDLTPQLEEYREQTRKLLDEWTAHHRRQRINDDAMMDAMKNVKSMAELIVLDRADKIVVEAAGCLPTMTPL